MDVHATDLEPVVRSEMLYKVHRLRILAATTLASSCIFFVVLLIPELRIFIPEGHHLDLNVIKRTRAVQAVVGEPSYKYDSQDPPNYSNGQKLITRQKDLLNLLKPSSEYVDDNYYDADEIVGDEDETDDYEDESDNDEFENGDFDYNLPSNPNRTAKTSKGWQAKNKLKNAQQVFRIKFIKNINNKKSILLMHRTHGRALRNVSLINVDGIPIVEDKIFWSKELEEVTPQGISDAEVQTVLKGLRRLNVLKAELPTWDRCGRPKNLFVVLEDGSKACARYRAPHQYLVQGEVLSFYLSRMLGIWNVPVVALTNSSYAGRWNRKVVRSILRQSEWQSNTTVALIQWIDNLERDKMPLPLISALINQTTISGHDASLLNLPVKGLVELLQWSDLILFDYITGNYDRVASMQDAAEKEKKPSILNETIHNLVRSKTTGGLWLIDNESGLIDSYSLLYSRPGEDSRFLNFHRQMLNSICLFRRKTVEHLTRLHWSGRAAEILMKYVMEHEPMFPVITHYDTLAKRLQDRIREVYHHIKKCSSDF